MTAKNSEVIAQEHGLVAQDNPRLAELKKTLRLLWKSTTSRIGMVIVVFFLLTALLAPWLMPYDPFHQDLPNKLAEPRAGHYFGQDNLGRDILSRVIAGTRISLGIALVVLSIGGVLGTVYGLVSGYFGGRIDEIMMRVTDMFLAFPDLILAMAFAALLGPNLVNTMIAISFVRWTTYARLVRGEVLRLRETEFVESARSLGANHFRMLFIHILPNALAPVIVRATMDMGGVILTAAGLSFIGFGAQPPTAEWGVMVADGRNFIMNQWWVSTFPGLAILVVVLGFNLLGDGLRDVLDPRLRGNI